MGRSLVDSERSQGVRRGVYLPDVDEFRSSSGPLSEIVLECLDPVASSRAKPLKEGYVADITREGGVSPSCVILGLLYIRRLTETNPRFLRTMTGKDLFLTSLVVASKYLNDEGESEALTNSEWAEVGCQSKPTLDLMERQFLTAIDWRLYVSLDEYYSFVTGIEGRIALNQFAVRGWLTYTDLVTIWDAMDTQRAVLTATKQVAKVTCGSAAVYLVLLSTLFTASHTLNSSWSPSSSSSPSPLPHSSAPTSTSTNSSSTDVVSLMVSEPPPSIAPHLPLETYLPPPPDPGHPLHNHLLQDSFLPNGGPNLSNWQRIGSPRVPCGSVSFPRPSSLFSCGAQHRLEVGGAEFGPGVPSRRSSEERVELLRRLGQLDVGRARECVVDCSESETGRARLPCGRHGYASAEEKTTMSPWLRGVNLDLAWTSRMWLGGGTRARHCLHPPSCLLHSHHHHHHHHHRDKKPTGTPLTSLYQYLQEWLSNALHLTFPHDALGAARGSNFSLDETTGSPHCRWPGGDCNHTDTLRDTVIVAQNRHRFGRGSYWDGASVDHQLVLPDSNRLWL